MRLPPTTRPLRDAPVSRPPSRRLNLLLCIAGLWGGTSLAQPEPAPAPQPVGPAMPAAAAGRGAQPARIGDATHALLELQRSASGPARPIPGEQAGLSYQRYLDSFRQPIPDALASTVQRGQGATR